MRAGPGAATLSRLHLESLDDLSTEHPWWGELAQRSGNLFATQEWLAAWSRHLGGDHELLACTARTEPGAEPFAVLALCRSPGGPLRFMGHTDSDRLAPVCAPEDRALAAVALRQALDLRAPGWESFLAEDLPAEEGWGHLLPGSASPASTARRSRSPASRGTTGWLPGATTCASRCARGSAGCDVLTT